MRKNRVMLADSYKYTHTKQYPRNTQGMFSYAEARSSKEYPETLFVGLQYILKEYFSTPIEAWEVEEAALYASFHGISFDYNGWMYIVHELGGRLPVEIRAVNEGSLIPTGNVLYTIESTDNYVFWIASWLETVLMNVWYPSNVATRSYYVRKLLEEYAERTQDAPNVAYQFHNFGARGSTCPEAAMIGGMAHLMVGFMGSDNFSAMRGIQAYYPVEDASGIMHSIDAGEHSTLTSWGKDGEFDMIMNLLENSKGKPLVAAPGDSYDYSNFVDRVTSDEFKKKIESDEYPVFVIRPDSGDPYNVIAATIDIMERNIVAYSINSKGFKVWNKYRIIWGDGINMDSMKVMLDLLESHGYSSENIAFGSGGWLMQEHSRDTQSWAIKCSNVTIDEGSAIDTGKLKAFDGPDAQETVWEPHIIERAVFKDPVTDSRKKSKQGKMTLYYNYSTDDFWTGPLDVPVDDSTFDIMSTVYKDGVLFIESSLDKIRQRNATCRS